MKMSFFYIINSSSQDIFQKGIKILVTITTKITYKFWYEKYAFWALICFFAQQYSLFGLEGMRKTSLLFHKNFEKWRIFLGWDTDSLTLIWRQTTCWTLFRRLAGQWAWKVKIRYEQILIAHTIQYGQLLWKMEKSMQNLLLISFYIYDCTN